jgi:hypothetical protein
MSLLKNLTTDETIANERDSVGGGFILDTDAYVAKIESAYITKAESEALGLVLNATTKQGKKISQTLWMTSGKLKGCKNYYEDKNGQKQYLPGFLHANAIALLTVGKDLSDLDTETKVIKAYNKEAKAEVPTKVEMVVDLLGQEVIIGLVKQVVDKTTKTPAGYVPTGETREQNEIDKIFRASDMKTVAEIRAQTDAEFYTKWVEKNRGQVQNKANKTGVAGTPGAPAAATSSAVAKPKQSLFI